jgi:hypothetical protein
MGGEAKAHAMYMRYWNLTKKPPQPNLNKDLPDLEELLQQEKDEGGLAKGSSRGACGTPKKGGGRKRKGKALTAVDSDDDELELPKKRSRATPSSSRKGGQLKQESYVQEEDDPERDAEGETDLEEV